MVLPPTLTSFWSKNGAGIVVVGTNKASYPDMAFRNASLISSLHLQRALMYFTAVISNPISSILLTSSPYSCRLETIHSLWIEVASASRIGLQVSNILSVLSTSTFDMVVIP
jgi:hypothetical protein